MHLFPLPTGPAAIIVSSITKGIGSLIDISLKVQSLGRLSSPWSTITERYLSTSIVFQGPNKTRFQIYNLGRGMCTFYAIVMTKTYRT